MSTVALDDPRMTRGMQDELALRRKMLGEGARAIGWKVGFGAPAALERLKISAPLVGFLTDRGLVASGGAVSTAGWVKPAAEPEFAVYIGRDLAGDASEDEARAAISALGPAIELADLNPPPEAIEKILGGNIFHKHVIVGEPDKSRAGAKLDGLVTRVVRNGVETARTAELEANTGKLVQIVRHVAKVLALAGERLRAGEFIIAGSITPPLFLDANDRELVHEVEGLGKVSVRFTH